MDVLLILLEEAGMVLDPETRREMYWTMLLARRMDERAWVLHRQGKIAFHISGIGQEAAQVGAVFALQRGYDWIAPYYRDLALMVGLGYTARDFRLGLTGKKGEPTSGGRQMPSHWSMRSMNVVSHSSPVTTQASHAVGIAQAIKMRKEDRVVLCTIGEGSTSQGEWYEALNWAAVHRLPVVFCVENNHYAISVPASRQMAVPTTADRACGMGMEGVCVDGTDVFATWEVVARAVARARAGQGPTLIEADVYRITPHSSDDDDRSYRSREEVELHKRNDCLPKTRQCLQAEGLLGPAELDALEARAKELVDDAVAFAMQAPYPDPSEAAYPVYAEDVRRG
jgi:2-oxoisovalerate dehydrogenase E1 component alpha subunit